MFGTPLTVEASRQNMIDVAPRRNSVEEDSHSGLLLEICPLLEYENRPIEVGLESPIDSSPKFPLGFEVPYGLCGKSSAYQFQSTSLSIVEGEIEVEESDEIEENGGEFVEKVP